MLRIYAVQGRLAVLMYQQMDSKILLGKVCNLFHLFRLGTIPLRMAVVQTYCHLYTCDQPDMESIKNLQ